MDNNGQAPGWFVLSSWASTTRRRPDTPTLLPRPPSRFQQPLPAAPVMQETPLKRPFEQPPLRVVVLNDAYATGIRLSLKPGISSIGCVRPQERTEPTSLRAVKRILAVTVAEIVLLYVWGFSSYSLIRVGKWTQSGDLGQSCNFQFGGPFTSGRCLI